MRFKTFYLLEYSYSCTMLQVSKPLAEKIKKFVKENIKEEDLYKDEADNGLPNYIHTTIKYGLLDDKPDKVKELIKDYGEFDINLGEISKFDNDPEYDVIKIDVKSDKLNKANKIISTNMDNEDTFKTYHPHITLAYVKKGKGDHLLGNKTFINTSDKTNEILFTNKDNKEVFFKTKDIK